MRLIDADKIRLNLWVPSRNNEIVKAFENSVIDALDRQPTVEAIPIEWIEEWVKTCIPRYDYDRMTYIADVYEMLEEWEKEK